MLALSDDESKRPSALSFMQLAVGRTWQKGGVDDILSEVLTKQALAEPLTKTHLTRSQNALISWDPQPMCQSITCTVQAARRKHCMIY